MSPPMKVMGAHLLESLKMKLDKMDCTAGNNPLLTRHDALTPMGVFSISNFCDLYCNMSFPLVLAGGGLFSWLVGFCVCIFFVGFFFRKI